MLNIHHLLGRKVKTLVSTEKEAGFHSIRWDATNDAGAPVSAGLYLYMIKARRLQTNEEDGTVEVAFL